MKKTTKMRKSSSLRRSLSVCLSVCLSFDVIIKWSNTTCLVVLANENRKKITLIGPRNQRHAARGAHHLDHLHKIANRVITADALNEFLSSLLSALTQPQLIIAVTRYVAYPR